MDHGKQERSDWNGRKCIRQNSSFLDPLLRAQDSLFSLNLGWEVVNTRVFVQGEFREMIWLESWGSNVNSTGCRGYDMSVENLHRSGFPFQRLFKTVWARCTVNSVIYLHAAASCRCFQ